MDKCLSPMSLETISDGSAESDDSPVNLLGFNLEFLGQEIIENITTVGLVEISNVVCLFKL